MLHFWLCGMLVFCESIFMRLCIKVWTDFSVVPIQFWFHRINSLDNILPIHTNYLMPHLNVLNSGFPTPWFQSHLQLIWMLLVLICVTTGPVWMDMGSTFYHPIFILSVYLLGILTEVRNTHPFKFQSVTINPLLSLSGYTFWLFLWGWGLI